jgi:hypothetical protein
MMDLYTWLESTGLATWVREAPTIFAFPMVITLHTFGLGVLVGASLIINLRLLGFAPGIPAIQLRSLYPVMWAAFTLNLVTGCMLFTADANSRGTSLLFLVKMLFVVGGVYTMVRIKRDLLVDGASPAAGAVARGYAVVSVVAWAAAIVTGRLLAYV